MRIGASLSGFERQLLQRLSHVQSQSAMHALRLATGQKVNRPADDPAAFLEISNLKSRLQTVNSTLKHVDTASSIAAQAQLGLDQVRTQLTTIRQALLEDENLSLDGAARDQKQAEIDAALQQIGHLAGSEFHGRRLLDGSGNFHISGRDPAQIREVQVFSLAGNSISGSVVEAATQATLRHSVQGQGQGQGQQRLQEDATFLLSGRRGSTTFEFEKNTQLTDVAEQINQFSHQTGVTVIADGNRLDFTTVDYGSQATLAIEVLAGQFGVTGGNGDGTAQGTDVVAEINGRRLQGGAAGDGNRLTYLQNGLHLQIEFAAGFSGAFNTLSLAPGGALQLPLSPSLDQIARLGLPGIQPARFRGPSGSLDQLASGGNLAGLGDNSSQALRVVDEALHRLTRIEGQVSRFADITIDSSAELLRGMQTVLQQSLEDRNQVDQVEESLLLAKNQDLASNILNSLAVLQGQRSTVVNFLQRMAGGG